MMTLPGKFTIGYLEEDVPQKAYFRIKPLFVKGDGAFEQIENVSELFPDDGGIRIVPDKNESNRFKARMRTLGRYCVLDLTHHMGENDKIRPNKNYNPDRQEDNRNIVYSDVVACCPDEWMCEVVRADKAEGEVRITLLRRPGTKHVALISGGTLSGPWVYEDGEHENEFVFRPDDAYETYTANESTYMRLFAVPLSNGEETEVIVSASGAPLFVRKDAPEAAAPAENAEAASAESAPEAPEAPAEEEPSAPAEAPQPESLKTDSPEAVPEAANGPEAEVRPANAARPEAEARPAARPETDARTEAPVRFPAAVRPEAPARPVPFRPEPPVRPEAPTKPFSPIRAEAPVRPVPTQKQPEPDAYFPRMGRIYAREQSLMGQTGLNPRRGRSLSEVVDDGWRRSRMDQLGAPVPGNAPGQPIVSPIERAAQSAREAWSLPEARQAVIDDLLKLDGFSEALAPRFEKGGKTPATSQQLDSLNDLEEERLKILNEIDTLRKKRIDMRGELLEEARQAHADEVKKQEETIARLKDESEKRLRDAEEARKTQADAQKLFDKTAREAFEGDFLKYAVHTRAAAMIREWDGADESDFAASPEVYEPNGAQLVSDVRRAFENAGRPLDNDEAVNLLACLAIGKITVFSGPTGCGKTFMAHSLASALGLTAKGAKRYIRLDASDKPAKETALFKALTRYEDGRTLRVALLDDMNAQPSQDQSRGLLTYGEDCESEISLRVAMTALDDQLGYPLDTRILDRAFVVRMSLPEATGWHAAKPAVACAPQAVSLDALQKIFKTDRDIPGEVESRMNTLLERLSGLRIRLSERTLTDMRAYCAAVIPLMTSSPKKALDYAFAQRALPHILATAKLPVLRQLPDILCDLPVSLSLLNQPLPLPPL